MKTHLENQSQQIESVFSKVFLNESPIQVKETWLKENAKLEKLVKPADWKKSLLSIEYKGNRIIFELNIRYSFVQEKCSENGD